MKCLCYKFRFILRIDGNMSENRDLFGKSNFRFLFRHYEDVLKLLKWPFVSGAENSPPPKEIVIKFTNLTRYLFLIQEPEDLITTTASEDFAPGKVSLQTYIKMPLRIINYLNPTNSRIY